MILVSTVLCITIAQYSTVLTIFIMCGYDEQFVGSTTGLWCIFHCICYALHHNGYGMDLVLMAGAFCMQQCTVQFLL